MKIVLLSLLIIYVCAADPERKQEEEDPLVHEYLKLALWLVFGLIVGVFF